MKKYKLPMEFDDGKAMYDAVLAVINKISPPLSKMIHDTITYNPFSLQLPDTVIALDMATVAALDMAMLEIVDELKEVKCGEFNSIGFEFEKVALRNHGVDYPMPDPSKIVRSWKNRWNAMYPEKIDILIPQTWERREVAGGNFLKIAYQNTVTHSLKLGKFPHITVFTGKARIKAYGDRKFIEAFNRLANFAEWCGTGAKTSMGCGVTRIERGREENLSTARETARVS